MSQRGIRADSITVSHSIDEMDGEAVSASVDELFAQIYFGLPSEELDPGCWFDLNSMRAGSLTVDPLDLGDPFGPPF